MSSTEKLVMLEKIVTKSKQLNHALDLLLRVKECYPFVFNECVSKEDLDKLGLK